MSLEGFFSTKFIAFVDNHKTTFLLIVLLAAVVYQYIDRAKIENRYFEENKRLNEKNIELTFKTLEYERERSERLEFILDNLKRNPLPVPPEIKNVK